MFKKFKAFEASARLEFKDPDTGHMYSAKKLGDLYKDIIQYRVQNGLELIENLVETVENYICGLPENCNKCTGVELHRSFYTYIKGGIALIKNIAFKKYATQEVAEERAKQCVACKFNVFPDKDVFTKWSDDIAIMQVGERKTSLHEELASCEVCTCALRGKVFFDGTLPPFTDEEKEKLESVKCWQLSLVSNK